MFEGTKLKFKLIYFITAMLPAYALFLVQMIEDYYTANFFSLTINKKTIILIITILIACLGGLCSLKLKKLISQSMHTGYSTKLHSDVVVSSKNGDVIAFLLGVIIPSVLTFSADFYLTVAIFVILQIFVYLLMVNSSSIFPNVVLIIFLRMNIYELNVNEFDAPRFIISFSDKSIKEQNVSRIGDSKNCHTYIVKEE